MKVAATALPDVKVIEPRGLHATTAASFSKAGTRARSRTRASTATFVQDNHSRSRRDVLRGLHYQIEHAQGKLVRCVSGEVFDVAVDLRRSSPTFGRCGRRRPFRATTARCCGSRRASRTVSSCSPTRPISSTRRPTTGIPEHERTLLWNDPALAIAWPIAAPVVNAKDAAGVPLAAAEVYP